MSDTDMTENEMPGTWHLMASDCRRWTEMWGPGMAPGKAPGFIALFKVVLNFCGLRASLIYRLSHGLCKARIPYLPGMLARFNLIVYGFDIPQHVVIGPGMYVPHPVGTVITAKRIGANVSLISAITIGMRDTHEFPTIGDNVFIGAGARILGDLTIGDGASIGANAVVLKDVPAGATAVGVPARIIVKAPDV